MSDEVKLPEPIIPLGGLFVVTRDLFSEAQLRAYGVACRKDEREKCAQECVDAWEKSGRYFEYLGCNDAANAIRARSTP